MTLPPGTRDNVRTAVLTGGGEDASAISCLEARNAAIHRGAPQQQRIIWPVASVVLRRQNPASENKEVSPHKHAQRPSRAAGSVPSTAKLPEEAEG